VIEREAKDHGAHIVPVDGSRCIAEIAETVAGIFGDALARGPRAEEAGERRAGSRSPGTSGR
jgi:hypothetical protein